MNMKLPLKAIPWISYSAIVDGEDRVIASCSKAGHQEVAKEIVKRCNLYNNLTKIAESANEVSQLIWDKYGDDIPPEFVVALMELDRKLGEIAKTESNHD